MGVSNFKPYSENRYGFSTKRVRVFDKIGTGFRQTNCRLAKIGRVFVKKFELAKINAGFSKCVKRPHKGPHKINLKRPPCRAYVAESAVQRTWREERGAESVA